MTAWVLRRRPENRIDVWDGSTYSRALVIHDAPVLVRLSQTGPPEAPVIEVIVDSGEHALALKRKLSSILGWMLGLQLDLGEFYRFAARHPEIRPLVERFRGIKPPCFPSLFEALVNGISCQQLSLAVGITLLNRLAASCGLRSAGREAFPRPQELSLLAESELRKIGYSGNKALALIALTDRILRGSIDLEAISRCEEPEALNRLDELEGIGPWTAQYALLRGLRRLSMFPSNDIGARRSLGRFLKREEPMEDQEFGKTISRWHPYGGLIYFHLLLNSLAQKGLLQ